MCLLERAASSWTSLQKKSYRMVLGRSHTAFTISLSFCPDEFYHLAGFQYLTDIDLGLNRAEFYGKRLLPVVTSGKITTEDIEKSDYYLSNVKGRLEGINQLETILDSDFQIYKFDPDRVPHGTRIQADYLIKETLTGLSFFVFLSDDGKSAYCRSIFPTQKTDYSLNQSRLTVLQKVKLEGSNIISEYTHPHYRPEGRASVPEEP